MTKLERAIAEAEKLPTELQEKLGDELLHSVHKLLALRDDLSAGVAELDADKGIRGEAVLSGLKARYGA